MLPAAFDVDRALADVHWLVSEIGPRVTSSPGEEAAAEGVATRLLEAGWAPQGVVSPRNLVACRGTGGSLFLAHIDSVPGSPGAGDNAAGVAILLELARTTQAEDLCLGFPVAEEVGLRGSGAMAAALRGDGSWLPDGGSLEQVVALDLVGWEGATELAANGLGTTWGGDGLSWLMQVARAAEVPLVVPYGYRAMSRAAPWMERSDHAPFAALGLPAMHLLHRGPHGVFPRYHQPADTEADGARLVEVAALLEAMATAPSPPRATQGAVDSGAFVLGRWRVPGWLTWGVLLAGLGSGAADLRRIRELPGMLWRGLLCVLGAALAMGVLAATGLFSTSLEEQTAGSIFGLPATGWWTAAPWALVASGAVFFGLRRALGPTGSAPLAAALLAVAALKLDLLVAAPLALGALLGRIHPALCLLGPLYLLRPDGLRELSFHGLLGPELWGVLWLLALPCIGRYERGSRRQALPEATATSTETTT